MPGGLAPAFAPARRLSAGSQALQAGGDVLAERSRIQQRLHIRMDLEDQ
jgi:hypothetical protein